MKQRSSSANTMNQHLIVAINMMLEFIVALTLSVSWYHNNYEQVLHNTISPSVTILIIFVAAPLEFEVSLDGSNNNTLN